ncbi:MAG: polysaccharide pyruvyl transferase family protein [Muribaculaceae bacterium]|nr:polysaccharide pyruvyl transferase family protein [Muribaculaceae bacterium]
MCQAAIITCHDIYNYGASLQTYALARFIEDIGHDVKIIDYKPDYLTKQFGFASVSNPGWDYPVLRQLYILATLPGRLMFNHRKSLFDEFTAKYLPLSSERYTSHSDLRSKGIAADLLIAGSGQIWNSRSRQGSDPAFYLDFGSNEARRISFGASFTSAILAQGSEKVISHHLGRFDSISVREASGVAILNQLGKQGTHVCDPIFLLSEQTWRDLASEARLPSWIPEKFVLLYDVEGSHLLRTKAKEDARDLHRPLVTIGNCSIKCGLRTAPCGPLEFLALMLRTRDMWSNSYHALAFSKLFGRRMNLIMRADISNARLLDLSGMSAEKLQTHINNSANFLLSEFSNVMRTVS